MALPSSGNSISLSQINTELGRTSSTEIYLNSAEDGAYAPINICSNNRPNPQNAASLSEWYSYDHSATCNTCYNGENMVYQSYVNTGDPSAGFEAGFNEIAFNLATSGNVKIKININVIDITVTPTINDVYAQMYHYVNVDTTGNDPNYIKVYLGDIQLYNIGNGTYDSDLFGAPAGIVFLEVFAFQGSYNGNTTNYTVTIGSSIVCPTIFECGVTNYTSTHDCGYTQSYYIDLGTASRTVSLTYNWDNNPSGSNNYGDLSINVVYNGTSIYSGTNIIPSDTVSFSYTYANSNSIAQIIFTISGWC